MTLWHPESSMVVLAPEEPMDLLLQQVGPHCWMKVPVAIPFKLLVFHNQDVYTLYPHIMICAVYVNVLEYC